MFEIQNVYLGTLANLISQLNTDYKNLHTSHKGFEDADDAIEGGYNGVLYPSANNGVGAYAYCFCFNLRETAYIQIAIGYRMTENTERYIWVRTKYNDIWSNWYKTALTT